MKKKTLCEPVWVHFGAGNFFRALPAAMMQRLLDLGAEECGIIAVAGRGGDAVDLAYRPYGCETVLVTLKPDGSRDISRIRSVAEAYRLDTEFDQIATLFENPSLQMVSFTVTEKAYSPSGLWTCVAELLRRRYDACSATLAMVSMDNCSLNGDKLREAVLSAVNDPELRRYISENLTFPLTMVDKITPSPDPVIAGELGLPVFTTASGTRVAPFVNAEEAEYLVIEDDFPNGRPKLELAGAIFTDRETVIKAERMKVSTCLNPLHTALAIFGCLLGYERFCDEMHDPLLVRLLRRLGYAEGLPVSPDPGILSPREFLDAVINERLPNPAIPDAPQRVAADTSQKIPIRFCETIKAYGGDTSGLIAVPLVIAGWLRYLSGTGDHGEPMALSPDPLLEELTAMSPEQVLADTRIFPQGFESTGLAWRILEYFAKMSAGAGAVRNTLIEVLSTCSDTE